MQIELIGCESFHMVNWSKFLGPQNRKPDLQRQFFELGTEAVYVMLIARSFSVRGCY